MKAAAVAEKKDAGEGDPHWNWFQEHHDFKIEPKIVQIKRQIPQMQKSQSGHSQIRPKSTWVKPQKKPATVKKTSSQSFQLDENKDPKKAFQPWMKTKPVTPKHSDFLQLEVG